MENTYVVSCDEGKECVIIDPGCSNVNEQEQLANYISNNGLIPVKLLNTHCHIDHILGNRFVADTWDLELTSNLKDSYNLKEADAYAENLGLPSPNSPEITEHLDEGDSVEFGSIELKVLFTPGHCAGHITFHNHADQYVISGDVLFNGSIGRTDLPGGDFDTLIKTIKSNLFTLDDKTIVYNGHGPETTIANEKAHNPFLK